MTLKRPAPRPCESCPYRVDVPSGVWAREEYEKLPRYDAETIHQPPGVFLCHQKDGRICAGWAACHDMYQSLGMRFAAAEMDPDELAATLGYSTPVQVFGSGAEACAHGLAELDDPGGDARRVMSKIERRRS